MKGRVLERDYVISRLRELFAGIDGVELAILFGSLAKRGFSAHDVDIAVKPSRELSLLDVGSIASRVAEALGVDIEAVDVVDLSQANPYLLYRVLSEGVVVKGDEKALQQLVDKASSTYPDALIELRIWSSLDSEPRLDPAVIASRVEEIRRNVRFLREEVLGKKPEELSYGEVLALERAVHRIIEAMLDICRHVVSAYSLGLAESYGVYPRRLAQAGLMPRELAEDLAKLAGLRNILVHRYLEVDVRKLHSAARDIADRIAGEFIEWVEKQLMQQNTHAEKRG